MSLNGFKYYYLTLVVLFIKYSYVIQIIRTALWFQMILLNELFYLTHGTQTSTINPVGWLVGFYGTSTFVGYLTPNPFLCK